MRKIINLNDNWQFIQKDVGLVNVMPTDWQTVNLPHTWNAVDGHDGNGSYDRGNYWYAKTFETPTQAFGGSKVFVEVLAAGQQATVYVNGTKVTYHEGGYSIFRADVTDLCKEDEENLLVIACSNEYKDSVYPQSADFTFYGGLYRGVNIICTTEAHFDLEYYGGPGIKVMPYPCDGGANFEIESFVKDADENFTVLYSILDADGKEVASSCRPADSTKVSVFVPDTTNWDIDNPYLYTVTAKLQRRNETFDEVTVKTGVRSFSCDPNKGFIINGVETPLRGVSRHQDQLYKGNALTREDHYEDARIIKDLGANTIRLAHYQHSQDFYDACDELGFVVWAEIPFISVFNTAPEAHQNCISQLKELIIQNYNHPSICFWGISNEILIGGISEKLVENHKELNALAKKLDPSRLTTIAHVSMTPVDSPMHEITDVISYNHYFGWYGGKMEDNGPWLDMFHEKHPDLCLGLSEYGCEGIITYHGPNPACKDYSEEYQALYHEHMAKVLNDRPWIWSSHVWNMFDFGCAARDEGGVKGRNNKGLVTMDRKTKKDSYFIYKAYWNAEPMVHVCGSRYAQRAGETTQIRVYSNQPSVALYLNGELVQELSADKVFVFNVALKDGFNTVLAVAGTDVMGISAGVVGVLMMAARFVDAFTDVTMGQIVDRSKPTKDGKFKPWIRRMAGPVAISSFMVFQGGFANMSYTFKVVWMTVTYLLWGSVFYTSINIPYGSMASAISADAKDRASLSTWRSVGGTLAALVIGVGAPLFAYETVNGNTVLSGSRMTIIAAVLGLLAVGCYLLCFNLVTERVEVPQNNTKFNFGGLMKSLFSNRSLIGIILASILLLLAMLGMSGMSSYVFPNYYGSPAAQSVAALGGTVATIVICAPLSTKLADKFGKKELSIGSCLFGAAVYLICLITKPANPFVYVAIYTVAYVSLGFFNMIIWAMITDVIDDSEVKNGIREDGTIYSVYSFARKIGQALSSGMIGGFLTLIGYTSATAFDPEVVNGIFNISCIIPIVGLVAVAVVLAFIYPLNKKRVEENVIELKKRRGEI